MAREPQVAIIASPSGSRLQASRANAALDLAEGLAKVAPGVNDLLGAWGKERAAEEAAKAEADALATSGQAFKEAVLAGKIEKTQNPWYIQAYTQRAAQVRAQGEMAALAADSQTWTERDDPAAFAARFAAETGKRAQAYTGIDAAAGFQAAAAPIQQQQLAANTAFNVNRIQTENEQNVSALTTKAIIDVFAGNGGKASPEQVWAALAPLEKQWLDTGGTEQSWNSLVVNSTIAAGANTASTAPLNILSDERGGKGALANMAGPDGTPVATTLMAARYRIEQEASSRGMSEIKARQSAIKLEGMQAVEAIQAQFGYDFLEGKISRAEVMGFLKEKGVSPAGADFALKELAESAAASTSLSRALAGGDPEVLQLYNRANTSGYSASLYSEVEGKVTRGEMDINEAEQILGTARSRSNQLESEANQDARSNRSDARADARESRAQSLALARETREAGTVDVSVAATALEGIGDRSLQDANTRARVTRGAADVANTWLRAHPGDYAGARAAQRAYMGDYTRRRIARQKQLDADRKARAADQTRR
jgi:hypothetical protein